MRPTALLQTTLAAMLLFAARTPLRASPAAPLDDCYCEATRTSWAGPGITLAYTLPILTDGNCSPYPSCEPASGCSMTTTDVYVGSASGGTTYWGAHTLSSVCDGKTVMTFRGGGGYAELHLNCSACTPL